MPQAHVLVFPVAIGDGRLRQNWLSSVDKSPVILRSNADGIIDL
jgi:hypothetical protein